MNAALWERFRARFCSWTGMLLPKHDAANAMNAFSDLAQARGLLPLDYLALCDAPDGRDHKQRVIDRLAVNTTWFLREASGVHALRQALVRRAAAMGDQRVRVWSAGCSTGQEPYSLAMALLEAGLDPQILATDISRSAIEIARKGRYPAKAANALPPAWIGKYVRMNDSAQIEVSKLVLACVTFEVHNLAAASSPWGPGGIDALVCCNVLIYFDRPRALEIVERLAEACHPDGHILLGASERPLVWLTDALTLDDRETQLIRPTKQGRVRRRLPSQSVPAPVPPGSTKRRSRIPGTKVILGGRTVPPPAQRAGQDEAVREALARLDARTGRWDYAGALETLDALLKRDVLLAGAHLARGLALKSAGRIGDAIEAFRCARFLTGDEAWLPPYELGVCLEQRSELVDACEAYRHALGIIRAGGRSGLALPDGADDVLMETVAQTCQAKLGLLRPARQSG
jgi:chemotaxis protein methyltransferase CheR